MKSKSSTGNRLYLADQLHSAAIRLLRTVRVQDAAIGIGPAQASALSVLVFAGPKSLKELAAIEQVKPPSMSRVVSALEASALVKLQVSHTDRRAILLRATAKGKRLMQKGRKRRISYLAKRFDTLDNTERVLLAEAGRIIHRILA